MSDVGPSEPGGGEVWEGGGVGGGRCGRGARAPNNCQAVVCFLYNNDAQNEMENNGPPPPPI